MLKRLPDMPAGDALLDRLWRKAEFWRQRGAQRSNGIFPRKIVDAAIAFGLAEDGQNRCRVDRAGADHGHEAGDVAGALGGDPEDADRCCPHCSPRVEFGGPADEPAVERRRMSRHKRGCRHPRMWRDRIRFNKKILCRRLRAAP
jgi:hypothetical protein